jgi:hypothetical protein
MPRRQASKDKVADTELQQPSHPIQLAINLTWQRTIQRPSRLRYCCLAMTWPKILTIRLSFQEWLGEKSRNGLTPKRKTIYVITPPKIGDEVGFVRSWIRPGSHARES